MRTLAKIREGESCFGKSRSWSAAAACNSAEKLRDARKPAERLSRNIYRPSHSDATVRSWQVLAEMPSRNLTRKEGGSWSTRGAQESSVRRVKDVLGMLCVSGLCHQDAVHITAILGESVVFNCHVEFPGEHPVPYVLQWEKKVGDKVRFRTTPSALYIRELSTWARSMPP